MLSTYYCGFQESSPHSSRGNEHVDLNESIVCTEECVNLVDGPPKDTVQSKQANETQSKQKARKNGPSIFNTRPLEYWSTSNTRPITLAPKHPIEISRNQKSQFSEQRTVNHIRTGRASSRSLPNNLLSSRNMNHSTSNCLRDRKSKIEEFARSSMSPQLYDERDPSVRHMEKEIKQKSPFSRGQLTQTTTNVTKRPAQSSIAPPKKTRKTKSHIDIDETDGDGGDYPGSGEVDTKKEDTFACPFYRKDPIRFLECINLRMVTIAIVKQHLKRRHAPKSHSSVGRKGISSSNMIEDHVREEIYTRGKIGSLDTIPPHILDALKIRSDRRMSSTAQWHEIWILLFGESNITPNPLLNGVVREMTGIIRDIWSKEGSQIVSNYLHARGIPLNSGQLLALLPELLDKVEGRFENKPLEDNSDEQHTGIKDPPVEIAIGETDGSHKSSAAPSQYPYHEFDPSDLIPITGSTSVACDSPKPISGVQGPHDFGSVGGAFESQATYSEYTATGFPTSNEPLLCMKFLSPADHPCDIFREGPLSQMAGTQVHQDWLGLSDDYCLNILEE